MTQRLPRSGNGVPTIAQRRTIFLSLHSRRHSNLVSRAATAVKLARLRVLNGINVIVAGDRAEAAHCVARIDGQQRIKSLCAVSKVTRPVVGAVHYTRGMRYLRCLHDWFARLPCRVGRAASHLPELP